MTDHHAGVAQLQSAGPIPEGPAPRSKPARRRITLEQRIDAVVALTEIYSKYRRDERGSASPAGTEAWYAVALLKKTEIDRKSLLECRDKFLATRLQPSHLTAFLRLHVFEFERAARLPHDPRTEAAHAAWDQNSRGNRTWDAYTNAVEAELSTGAPP